MKTLVLGIVLLAVSSWPLFLMGRELAISSAVRSQYSVEILREWQGDQPDAFIQGSIGGHTVQLVDDAPASTDDNERVVGEVRILVDGRDYSSDAEVTIRPAFWDANRYWGYVLLKRLIDQKNGTEHLIVAQSIRNRYRLLWVSPTGQVLDETFDYEDRCEPPVRADLISYVVPHPVGYCSDLMQVWPGLVYPILFPWTSGLLGFVCTVAGLVIRWRARIRSSA